MNNESQDEIRKEDSIRAVLTVYTTVQGLLLICFFGAAPFVRLGFKSGFDQPEAIGVVELILPVFTGYVGMMLGFYFGTKESK